MGIAIPAWLDAGAGAATCNLLTAGSYVAATVAVNSARSLLLWPTLGAAAASAAFGAVAYAMNCTHNAGSPSSEPGLKGTWCPDRLVQTQFKAANGTGGSAYGVSKVVTWRAAGTGMLLVDVTGYTSTVSTNPVVQTFGESSLGTGVTASYTGGCSAGTGVPPGGPEAYNYNYTDSGGCIYKYSFKDAWIGADGYPQIAWEINGATALEAKATGCSGGRIAGYVWSPNVQNRYLFNPSFDFGGGGGGLGNVWDDIAGNLTSKLVAALLETKFQPATYRLVSACELDADGEPIDRSYSVSIPANSAMEAIIDRLDAIGKWADSPTAAHGGISMLQALKDYKQPVCYGKEPTGRIVTVNFVSSEDTPAGGNTLRKVLHYRDQTSKPDDEHRAHWIGFEWQAGPAIVTHKGASWGKVQVWAATEAEGKRVIQHAAAIAGVNLAQGQWKVGSTTNGRYGRTGRMGVEYWDLTGKAMVGTRDTPSGIPSWKLDL